MKSPSTSGTMSQIMKRHCSFASMDSNDSDLVHSVLKIQKYKTSKNILKAVECVALLKKKYSIRNAARKLNMQYSHLHRLLSIDVNNVTIVNRDSDDSDYEDDLPLIYVKEGLKDISQGESPVGHRTRRRLHEKKHSSV